MRLMTLTETVQHALECIELFPQDSYAVYECKDEEALEFGWDRYFLVFPQHEGPYNYTYIGFVDKVLGWKPF